MTPVDAQMPISVTLAAEQWNGVLQIMGEAPVAYKFSAPLIQSIGQQMQKAAEAVPAAKNGSDIVRHIGGEDARHL